MRERCRRALRRRWPLLAAVLAGAIAASAAAGAAADPPAKSAAAEPQPPVHITADSAEYFNKEGRVVFSGSVVAIQGDSTLTSDRMEVQFSEPGGASPAAVGERTPGRRITQITALGQVTFRQLEAESKKERFATGEKGVYDAERREVTLTGNPRLWEGKNVIVGEQMVFRLDDKNYTARGKVNLTVYPDEAKEERKP